MMKTVLITAIFLLAVQSTFARLSASDMRKALKGNPLFSHKRNKIVPQNINIIQNVADVRPTISRQEAASFSKSVATRPAAQAANQQIVAQPRPLPMNPSPPAPGPQRPRPTPQRTPVVPAINDRMADRVQSKPTRQAQSPAQRRGGKKACPFSFPSFMFSDTNMTQLDFEQKYLIPALRAHIGGNCNSRAMTIYLDWLLHLRERLFNV